MTFTDDSQHFWNARVRERKEQVWGLQTIFRYICLLRLCVCEVVGGGEQFFLFIIDINKVGHLLFVKFFFLLRADNCMCLSFYKLNFSERIIFFYHNFLQFCTQ